jgi:hypothetical protein
VKIYKKMEVHTMTLLELQKILGSRITVTLQEDLSPEERQIENEQTALIIGVAKQMINNGDLILRTEKLMAQTKSLTNLYSMQLIDGSDGKFHGNDKSN